MRLRSLTVRNIKLLADQTFDFGGEEPRLWTALIGDNGLCKTTVLQAIALTTSGEKLARLLVDDATEFVRADRRDKEASIEACFHVGNDELNVEMRLEPGSFSFTGNDDAQRLDRIRDKRQSGFFVAGYGTGRRLPKKGEVAVPRDPVAARVQGLFDTHHKMLGVDFFDALSSDVTHGRTLGHAYAKELQTLLLAEDDAGHALLPALNNLILSGKGGVNSMRKLLESRRVDFGLNELQRMKLAPHQLSQGYQSMFAWLADLLGHAFLDQGDDTSPSSLEGLVLLDEIDLHLHPTWQRRVVPALRRAFPKLQFVVTTHSPLLLTGLDAHEIIGLVAEGGEVRQKHFTTEPGLKNSMELMEEFFDVSSAGRPSLVEKQNQLSDMYGDGQDGTPEYQKLRSELARYSKSTSFSGLPSLASLLDTSDSTP